LKLKINNYWFILVTQIFLIILSAFVEDHPVIYFVFVFGLIAIYGSLMRAMWGRGLLRFVALAAVSIAVVTSLLWVIPGISEAILDIYFTICVFSYAVYIAIAIVTLLKDVYQKDNVTLDRIIASVCVYLLFGMFFAFIYCGISILDPTAFDFGGNTSQIVEEFRDYIYFSFVTLTTTGFGDMLPMSPITRILSALEAITGSIYLVVMVAGLVGMHVSSTFNRKIKGGK